MFQARAPHTFEGLAPAVRGVRRGGPKGDRRAAIAFCTERDVTASAEVEVTVPASAALATK
jgi:hypothetical protein